MQLYGLNKQTLLVAAGRKKFGPSVQGGASVHDLDLLHEAEPALLGGGSEQLLLKGHLAPSSGQFCVPPRQLRCAGRLLLITFTLCPAMILLRLGMVR